MGLDGTNVDNLTRQLGYETRGFVRHNRFSVDMVSPNGNLSNVAAFSVKIPGWDISTVTETNVERVGTKDSLLPSIWNMVKHRRLVL